MNRVVYVTSNLSSAFSTFTELEIPNDPHVAIVLHYDEPMIFTHQRASWKHCPPDMPLVTFPGRVPDMSKVVPADHFAAKASGRELTKEEVLSDFIQMARKIAQLAPGKEVLLGEFGSYEQAPPESRRIYTATVRDAAEREGWGWTIWDYKSSFGIRTADGASTAALDGILSR
jgi:endoglucanase